MANTCDFISLSQLLAFLLLANVPKGFPDSIKFKLNCHTIQFTTANYTRSNLFHCRDRKALLHFCTYRAVPKYIGTSLLPSAEKEGVSGKIQPERRGLWVIVACRGCQSGWRVYLLNPSSRSCTISGMCLTKRRWLRNRRYPGSGGGAKQTTRDKLQARARTSTLAVRAR